jgi:hypothetical protein
MSQSGVSLRVVHGSGPRKIRSKNALCSWGVDKLITFAFEAKAKAWFPPLSAW